MKIINKIILFLLFGIFLINFGCNKNDPIYFCKASFGEGEFLVKHHKGLPQKKWNSSDLLFAKAPKYYCYQYHDCTIYFSPLTGVYKITTNNPQNSIYGIKVGDSNIKVKETLGEPTSIKNTSDNNIYTYKNLKIEVQFNRINNTVITLTADNTL